MAANLITMAGRIPGKEIPIVFTGLRPGEKLYEELLTGDEEETVQVRDRISVAKGPPTPPDLARQLSYLREFADEGDRERVLEAIQVLVPSYRRTPGQAVVPAPGPTPPGLRATVTAHAAALAPGWREEPEAGAQPELAEISPDSTPS
jgi:hypothetical protein